MPSTPTVQPPVANEAPLAARDPSTSVHDRKPMTPTPQLSGTNGTPVAAYDLESYVWAAALVVMIGALFGFSIGILSRMSWRKR